MLASLRAILRSEDVIVDALRKRGVEGGKKVVLDFSSPNIAKTFHAGNLRSTLVGNFLQKTLKAAGYEVTSINYLGDWGIQFAMLATYWRSTVNRPSSEEWRRMSAKQRVELLTKSYAEANAKLESNSSFKERVHQAFRDMERLHTASPYSAELEELRWCKEWGALSRDYLKDFYSRFHDVRFDEWHAESEQVAEGARVVDELIRRGVVRQDGNESYWSVPIGQPGGGAVVRKSDGTSLYLTRDLGAIYARHKRFNANEYLYVVEQSQHKHFEQLKALVRALGDEKLADSIRHISFGRIIGLSTRGGKNDSVDYLIEAGEEEAKEALMQSSTTRLTPAEMAETCNKLSRSILVFDMMSKRRVRSYTFSFKDAFSPEGKTAAHLQEKYSRLSSMELRNADLMERVNTEENLGRYKLETSKPTERLIKQIRQFDNAVFDAYQDGEACRMCSYLVALAQQIGKSVAQLQVYGEVEKVALPRLMLLSAAKRLLGDGMRFVGIEPMEKT